MASTYVECRARFVSYIKDAKKFPRLGELLLAIECPCTRGGLWVRCYFMREKRIAEVFVLEAGSDGDLIRQAKAIFDEHADASIDGFEVWSIDRFVYRLTRPGREPLEF